MQEVEISLAIFLRRGDPVKQGCIRVGRNRELAVNPAPVFHPIEHHNLISRLLRCGGSSVLSIHLMIYGIFLAHPCERSDICDVSQHHVVGSGLHTVIDRTSVFRKIGHGHSAVIDDRSASHLAVLRDIPVISEHVSPEHQKHRDSRDPCRRHGPCAPHKGSEIEVIDDLDHSGQQHDGDHDEDDADDKRGVRPAGGKEIHHPQSGIQTAQRGHRKLCDHPHWSKDNRTARILAPTLLMAEKSNCRHRSSHGQSQNIILPDTPDTAPHKIHGTWVGVIRINARHPREIGSKESGERQKHIIDNRRKKRFFHRPRCVVCDQKLLLQAPQEICQRRFVEKKDARGSGADNRVARPHCRQHRDSVNTGIQNKQTDKLHPGIKHDAACHASHRRRSQESRAEAQNRRDEKH